MKVDRKYQVFGTAVVNRVGWHMLFWVIATVYLALSFRGGDNNFLVSLIDTLYYLPAHVFLVYYLLYFLMPRFLLKRKFIVFILLLIPALFLCVLYIRFIDLNIQIRAERFNNRIFFRALFANFNVAGIAVAIKFFKYWFREREEKLQAERNNLFAQLQILKAQIHPHFLFNTLNNLYALTLERSEHSALVVLKLSTLLRYMLYDANAPSIPLSKELEMIQNYIELEQFRYGQRLETSIHCEGNYKNKSIAPLLLLPFVENALKHGAKNQIGLIWMHMDIMVENNKLYFKLSNNYVPDKEKSSVNGIGLNNVKNRLRLLYGQDHSLKVIPEGEIFVISLEITLSGLKQTEISNQ